MKSFLIYTLIACCFASVVKREKLLGSISKEITGKNDTNTFSVTDIKKIFSLLGFKNCSKESIKTHCQLCLGVEDLLKWHNYSSNTSFNRSQFQSLLPSVLFFLTPLEPGRVGAVCNKSTNRSKNLTQSAYNSFLHQYGKGKTLPETQIDKILDHINGTLKARLTKKPCFDVDDALTGSGVSEEVKNERELEYLSSYLILQLIEGHCIAEHAHKASTLPKSKEFIDSLFKEYGTNGTISLDKFEALLKKLGIGNEAHTTTTTTGGSHAGHDHRKRRSIEAYSLVDDEKNEASSLVNDEQNEHRRQRRSAASGLLAGKCFTPENLLSIHSINQKTGMNQTQFKDLCPSLIQQIEGGTCKKPVVKKAAKTKEQGWKPWLSAIVSVLVISVGSLVGIFVAPFSDEKGFSMVLTFLIGIAVATLLGDAVLHLFPHSLNLHKHDEGAAHQSITSANSFVWKSLTFLAGVYLFYLFELFLHSLTKHKHSHGLEETHQHVGKARSHSMVSGPAEIIHERKDIERRKESGLITSVSGIHKCDETVCLELEEKAEKHTERSEIYVNEKSANGALNGKKSESNGNGKHTHNGIDSNGQSHVVVKGRSKYKSVAWMVLMGDAIHNFLDGIAIGVAFTDKFPGGFFGGISTSIAILCHELPHELGDFAILIQSGMPIKMALLLNFLSSLTSVVGALIGVSLGQAMDASNWIFALTAGLFVYIALTDMLPELIHSPDLRHSPVKTIMLQNAGLFLGFAIMVCLALFEEDIKIK